MLEQRRLYFELVKQQHVVHERWQNEWFQACEEYQKYDVSKIKFLKANIWEYANAVSSACLADDQSSENIRLSLENCSYKIDIPNFADNFGTGNKIRAPMEFVDYAKGQFPKKTEQLQTVTLKNIPMVKREMERQESKLKKEQEEQKAELTKKKNPPPKMSQQERTKFELMDRRDETFRELQEQAQKEAQDYKIQQENELRQPKTDIFGRHQRNDSETSYKVMSEYSNPTSMSSYTSNDLKDTFGSSGYSNPLSSSMTSKESRPTEPIRLFHKKKNVENNEILKNSSHPLEAYLHDLHLGGNGNMSKFRDSMASVESSRSKERLSNRNSLGNLLNDEDPFESRKNRSKPSSNAGFSRRLEQDQQPSSMRRSKSQTEIQSKYATSSSLPSKTSDGYTVLKYCRAQYNYKAEIEQELSFKKRDTLMIIHEQPDGWWYAENVATNETGLAPSNYLVEI
ncbi:unnamed protein product [Ambrosiozyma monospora]|uniref:Unnamed protein product n=1 Tax=Ambrosiozyma monospora TaxID=43982 RepID=A0A9W7DKD3_AMBMO|nr:unnamed protein product [Ambrosiozyma monospora]